MLSSALLYVSHALSWMILLRLSWMNSNATQEILLLINNSSSPAWVCSCETWFHRAGTEAVLIHPSCLLRNMKYLCEDFISINVYINILELPCLFKGVSEYLILLLYWSNALHSPRFVLKSSVCASHINRVMTSGEERSCRTQTGINLMLLYDVKFSITELW